MDEHLEIVSLRNVCRNKNSQKLINRLTKKPISMLGKSSFKIIDLISHRNDDMYIFVNNHNYKNLTYVGFCKIHTENQINILSQFEIFYEHRNKGYGKFFARMLYDNNSYISFNEISKILNCSILFWWKAIPFYFENMIKIIIEKYPKNIEHQSTELEEYFDKYYHKSEKITCELFRIILQYYTKCENAEYTDCESIDGFIEKSYIYKEMLIWSEI